MRRRILTRADLRPTPLVSAALWALCVLVAALVLLGSTMAWAGDGTAQEAAAAASGWAAGGGALGLGATLIYVARSVGKAADSFVAEISAAAKHREGETRHWDREEQHHTRIEGALDEALSALPGAKRRPTGERIAALESDLSGLHDKLDRILSGEHTGPIHVARRQP